MIGKMHHWGSFINKKNTHRKVPIDSINYEFKKDEITTRIMSLIGMELNINKEKIKILTKEEYIFMVLVTKNQLEYRVHMVVLG